MGSPITPLLANMFMVNYKLVYSIRSKDIIFWSRYVDDILACFTGIVRQLNQFVVFINNVHPNIKFTSEKENNNSINFSVLKLKDNWNSQCTENRRIQIHFFQLHKN